MKLIKALCLFLVFSATTAQASLVFTLDPGATITSRATGETESLFGSFELEFSSNLGDLVSYRFLSLELFSDSISLSLSSDNRFGLATFFVDDPTRCGLLSCRTSLSAEVFSTGFDVSADTPMLLSGFGNHEGDTLDPTRFMYEGLTIYPSAGGLFRADLSFSASRVTAVSAPSHLALLFFGLAFLVARKSTKH